MFHWIEAYSLGFETREAQVQARNFSSTKYRSHRRISQGLQAHLVSILPLYRAELGSGRFPSTAAHY